MLKISHLGKQNSKLGNIQLGQGPVTTSDTLGLTEAANTPTEAFESAVDSLSLTELANGVVDILVDGKTAVLGWQGAKLGNIQLAAFKGDYERAIDTLELTDSATVSGPQTVSASDSLSMSDEATATGPVLA